MPMAQASDDSGEASVVERTEKPQTQAQEIPGTSMHIPSPPLTSQTAARHREIFAEFKVALDRLMDAVAGDAKIDGDSPQLAALSGSIECILQNGFRGRRQWLLGGDQDVWPFVRTALAANDQDLVDAVQAAPAPNGRAKTWILMALMQQQLGRHLRVIAAAAASKEAIGYYRDGAMMAAQEWITPVVDLLDELDRCQLNICMRRDSAATSPTGTQSSDPPASEAQATRKNSTEGISRRPSISQLLIDRGDVVLKSGIAATWSTLGRVQAGVGAARGLIIDAATTTSRTLPFGGLARGLSISSTIIPENLVASESSKTHTALSAAEESIAKLIADQHDLSLKVEELEESLSHEHRARLALEVELVSVKMARDKELARMRREIAKLENQIAVSQFAPSQIQEELLKTIEERDALHGRLENIERVSPRSNPSHSLPPPQLQDQEVDLVGSGQV